MTTYTPMYIFQMNIGDLLDQAMKRRGIRSQGALSRLSGVPQPTINRTLKNVSVPEFSTLKKLADALDVDVRSLMDGDISGSTSVARVSPEAEQAAMVGKYVRRLTSLFAGRTEDEITRVVRAIEILMPAQEAKADEPARHSRKISLNDDETAAEASFSRRPRRKSGTHE
ncbi:transcriptional regulator with XRE-family HTH domain [Paraburkholderia sp. MM5496-R1]|uniref:helix-turn-helix domain-containing protein n=1 Tax=Paraburkholderia sp. MM5496-R1 TaxID=2991065 RepID=UPI003D1907B5